MESTQGAGCQLQRKNSFKKEKKRRRKWTTPNTGVNQEAIKKAIKEIEEDKKANSRGVEEVPVIACTIDGPVNPPARCIGSETRLDCRMDSPTAQERARMKSFTTERIKQGRTSTNSKFSMDVIAAQERAEMKSFTLGRTKQGWTSMNSEFNMDGITAQEMKSFTLSRIKQTESIKNSESSCSLPSRAQQAMPHHCTFALVLSCCMLLMFVIACVEWSHSHHIYPPSLVSCSSSVLLSTYVNPVQLNFSCRVVLADTEFDLRQLYTLNGTCMCCADTMCAIMPIPSTSAVEGFARADSVNEAEKPKVARRQRPHTCVSHEFFKALTRDQEVKVAKKPDAEKNIGDSSVIAPKDVG